MKSKQNLTVITEDESGERRQVVSADALLSALPDKNASEVILLDAQGAIGAIVSVLLRHWTGEEDRSQAVIEALLPDELPSAAATEQLRQNAAARANFLEEFPALPASELAALAGVTWANPGEWPSRLKKEGKVFSVEYGRRKLFPAFQFDGDWQPLEQVGAALHELREAGLQGWSVALWWVAANGWLEGARPVDLVAARPEAVVAAAAEVGQIPS